MKPESNFIARVHRHLDHAVYREKMHNAYRGGTPDVWYSGNKADMWAEYKFVEIPKGDDIPIRVSLTELQRHWITERQKQGRNVKVIVGCKEGGVVLDKPVKQMTKQEFISQLKPVKELAMYIEHATNA